MDRASRFDRPFRGTLENSFLEETEDVTVSLRDAWTGRGTHNGRRDGLE